MTFDHTNRILTIGHSTQSFNDFLDKIVSSGVTAIADVRSSPFSQYTPQFSQPNLKKSLKESNIQYVFLGQELGGRPQKSHLYCNGIADYEKISLDASFISGLERLINGSKNYNIAIMCSEQNPLDCHRCLLIGRLLHERKTPVGHILKDGNVIEHKQIEDELLKLIHSNTNDLFASKSDLLEIAYKARSKSIAYREAQTNISID